jgi:hypothetical protein
MTSILLRPRARLCAGLLTVFALLGGCKATGASRHPAGAGISAGETEGTAAGEPQGDPVVFASVGVPHVSPISLVALDPFGKVALTRDTAGAVRFWAALDGSREPLVVPIRDPRAMALASDGEGGWTLALIDAAGGARIVGVDESGAMQKFASLPPTDAIAEILVLPDSGRLVVVGSDHVIRLLDRRGTELARFDEPGLRPASLRIAVEAEGGPRVVALTAGELDDQGRFAVEVLPLELGEGRLALASGRQTIHLDAPPTRDNPSLAPDGRAVVFLQRQRLGGATWKVVGMQLDDGRQVSVDSQLGLGAQPRVGLLSAGRVLLDDGNGLGRIVDLSERTVELTPLRSAPTLNHAAATFAPGVRAAPAGNWLAIHDLADDELAYLGYEQVSVTDAGLSPAARRVAWALGDRVAVEALEGSGEVGEVGEVVEVPGTRATSQRFVGFLDEELLVMLDWNGGIELVRWRDGEIVDAGDLGSNVQLAQIARAGEGSGVLFVRTNLWQNPLLVELAGGKIAGQYLTHAAANHAGLLALAGEDIDAWGAWTIDGTAKLRDFSLARLRPGLDIESALQGGEALESGIPEHFARGADGARYWIRTTTHPTLYVQRGKTRRELQLAAGFVVMMVPSHDGTRLALVQQRDPGQVLTVYATEPGAEPHPLWAQPIPAINGLSWSDESEAIALAANLGGGVVLDGDQGTPRTARCGLAFERRHSPPISQGLFNQLSVCEI